MGRSVKYSSPSTIKRSYRRLVNHLHKLLTQSKHPVAINHVVHACQPVEDKPQEIVSETPSQPSEPMTLQDLKNYMSSASKAMEGERKNELEKEMDKRKKEREEDIENLKVMLGLPP